jgi:hypothetical protein
VTAPPVRPRWRWLLRLALFALALHFFTGDLPAAWARRDEDFWLFLAAEVAAAAMVAWSAVEVVELAATGRAGT